MSFLQQLVESYGGEVSDTLSKKLDIPESQASELLPKIAPLILGGLAAKAQKNGPESVAEVIAQHGNEAALENVEESMVKGEEQSGDILQSLMGGGMSGLLGGGGLGGLLGGGSGGGIIGQILGQHLGIEGDKAMKTVSMLAPILLGALAKKKSEAEGDGMNAILSILDEDGDGNAINDLAAKFLGGGGLGGALSGMFGGKK
tara:strand:- start:9453 stop:10058 length:606 start_codon:yes stop_codon:yes gene_type:complete